MQSMYFKPRRLNCFGIGIDKDARQLIIIKMVNIIKVGFLF